MPFHPIVYRNGFEATLYVQENYVGKISFEYPCSISGTNSIISSLIAHPLTGAYPSWISINTDYEDINVIAPSYGGSNTYYFGVRSIIFGENVDKLATITVYRWLVSNWASWSYTTISKWDVCQSNYNLSSTMTSWIAQVPITNPNAQAPQESTQVSSQTIINII